MKAYMCSKYGSPNVLTLKELPKPIPQNDQVLVRILATSINSADNELLRGIFLIRLGSPFKPAKKILGSDVSGVIEMIGPDVKDFAVGDFVYADTSGVNFEAFAEYVCLSQKNLRAKPSYISTTDAGGIPSAAVLAYQSVIEVCTKSTKNILINGAGGGMGMFAMQIAKAFGLSVTAVDNKYKQEKMINLGADYVIDYEQEDFTKQGIMYDAIIDCYGTRNMRTIKKALDTNGHYILVGGKTLTILQAFIASQKKKGPKISVLMAKYNNQEYLKEIESLIASNQLSVVIDSIYKYSNLKEAFIHYQKNTFFGKILIVHDAKKNE